MKYDVTVRMMGRVLDGIMKKTVPDKRVRKEILKEYRAVYERVGALNPKGNPLILSCAWGAYFIALNRKTEGTPFARSPEDFADLFEEGLRNSRLVQMGMGNADGYFSEKHMAFRRDWSARTKDPAQQEKYPADWVVDLVEGTSDPAHPDAPFVFGFDYRACGVCKMFRAEGCPEWAKYMCRLDYMLSEMMGVHLDRTQTLAEGGECCDFRFSEKK